MALTPERIRELWENYSPTQGIESFAHAIETEARKQDDELIQQLVEALERCTKHDDADYAALLAGRARLGRPHD